jgi:hypothetical protein
MHKIFLNGQLVNPSYFLIGMILLLFLDLS